MNATDLAARLPRLFAPSRVDYVDSDLTFTVDPVPEELINRLHLVAVTADGNLVVCESVQGWRFLPGGTREPGESIESLARREGMEEAGIRLDGPARVFAAHRALSGSLEPYRPHLSHPLGYWAYASAPATIVGEPTCPPGDEQIVAVQALPWQEAVEYLEQHGPDHADVVRLAMLTGLLERAED